MPVLAPRWAFAAQALDSAGDPHLAAGIHLRVVPSALLGLPVAPLLVYRASLGTATRPTAAVRTDVTWLDATGNVLTPPFSLTAGQQVTGVLPPAASGVCYWIDVAGGGPLRVDAVAGSALGPALIGSRSAAPYTLSASRIERVVVRAHGGPGTVTGVRWLDAHRFLDLPGTPRLLGLPVGLAARYAGTADAEDRAVARVGAGAPLRIGLHDAPDVDVPAAAPATGPDPADRELERVLGLAEGIRPWLDRLVGDTSTSVFDLREPVTLLDGDRRERGTAGVACLGGVLHAALDPGVGRWLGLVDLDPKPPGDNGTVAVWLLRGIWQVDEQRLGPTRFAQVSAGLLDHDAVARVLDDVAGDLDVKLELPKELGGPFLDAIAVAAVTLGVAHDPPTPPVLAAPVAGPWLPSGDPDGVREVALPASGLLGGGTVALARQTGGDLTGLNPTGPGGFARPLVAAVPADATDVSEGTFTDRAAPPNDVSYGAAQADWFGRWSARVPVSAPDGVRPAPPEPVLSAHYAPPPDPAGREPLPGVVTVQVTVPPQGDLAPGSRPLASVSGQLTVQGSAPVTFSQPVSAAGGVARIDLAGPSLPPAGIVQATVAARFADADGTQSPPSPALRLLLSDPRPPDPVQLDSQLRYASRPDPTGRARVELRWIPRAEQQAFRVYYSDETRLSSGLTPLSPPAGPGATVTERAAALQQAAASLPRAAFEQLTGVPVAAPANGQAVFRHDLPGALSVLSCYRVTAVSAGGVESDFSTAPLIPVAVPNTRPPARPVLRVLPSKVAPPEEADPPGSARLAVQVPAGLTAAAEYRLRRSRGVADPARLPVAHTAPVDAAVTDGSQRFEILDTGPTELDPAGKVDPWNRYTWSIEVRGAAEPGAPPDVPPGEWSPPSVPVSADVIPPAAPTAPTDLAAVPSGLSRMVMWNHPDTLRGGGLGNYAFQVSRHVDGGKEQVVTSITVPAGGAEQPAPGTSRFTFRDLQPLLPATIYYRVVLIDPIGRRSPVATAKLTGAGR